MLSNPKKEKIVNGQEEEVPPVNIKNAIKNGEPANPGDEGPLAPIDPRLRKPGNEPLQANQDPLNGVNE